MRAPTSQISCSLLVWAALKGVCLFQTDGEFPVWQCQSHTSVQTPKKNGRPGVWEISWHPYL